MVINCQGAARLDFASGPGLGGQAQRDGCMIRERVQTRQDRRRVGRRRKGLLTAFDLRLGDLMRGERATLGKSLPRRPARAQDQGGLYRRDRKRRSHRLRQRPVSSPVTCAPMRATWAWTPTGPSKPFLRRKRFRHRTRDVRRGLDASRRASARWCASSKATNGSCRPRRPSPRAAKACSAGSNRAPSGRFWCWSR